MRKLVLVLCCFLAFDLWADWERIAKGVDYEHILEDGLDVHIVRIDLRERSIRVIATGQADRGTTVSEFARRNKALVAINADYFDKELRPIGLAKSVCGVWWEGAKVGRRQGLIGVGRRRAEIQERTMIPERWMTGSVSGWPLLVRDCEPIDPLPGSDHFTRAPHPRTAAGLSEDRRTMYLVVADGRRDGVPGPTLPELADLLAHRIGACVALNLDGGGSSAMWLSDRIVNQPSDGAERRVGNHLAVVAAEDFAACEERPGSSK